MNDRDLSELLARLADDGYGVVEDVLGADFRERTRDAVYTARAKAADEIGADRLEAHNELGVARIPMKFDDHFFRFLELEELLAVVDSTLGDSAILNRQGGLILPSFPPGEAPSKPQNRLHQEFRWPIEGYLPALNVLFAIDDFTTETGATRVVPGSHQQSPSPPREQLEERAVSVACPAGSMLVFDSTLWHSSGENVSGRDRLGVTHVFVRPFIKQQFDYCRALGEEKVRAQSPRVQHMLGWTTRVPASLDEYYRPPEERLFTYVPS
jgi:ectoine hydroxylase-related dioxygenase (phytanoyl-CoA dioxygenase family)